MEAELLKKQRAAFKGQLTQFKTKITSSASIGEFESLLRRVQKVYDKYDSVQSKLEALDDSAFADRSTFEDDYGALETSLRNKLHDIKKLEDTALSTSFLNASHHDASTTGNISAGIRLPEITLPSFNGREAEWLAFRDVFVDLIHSKTLEPTVKFLYLISSIRTGTAFRVIESLPVTAGNYELAWKSLCDRYDNEINIQKLHMRELYEVRSPAENSAKALEDFLDRICKHYNALQSLKVNVATWDLMLVYHLTQRLDNSSKVYIVKNSKLTSLLSFSEFVQLLRTRIRVLQVMPTNSTQPATRSPREGRRMTLNTSLVAPSNSYADACVFCSGSHTLPDCPGFTDDKFSPRMRFNFIKDRRYCGNCLVERHLVNECKGPPCSKCKLKHHILLHFSFADPAARINPLSATGTPCLSHSHSSNDTQPEEPCQFTSCSAAMTNVTLSAHPERQTKSVVLLGTALVKASVFEGTQVYCRALLDSGSTLNFITASTCSLLKAKKVPTSKTVAGIRASQTSIKYKTYITVSSRVSNYHIDLKFYVIPKITTDVPSVKVVIPSWSVTTNIDLADPQFNIPGRIDLLLGADIYHQLFKGSSMQVHEQLPLFHLSEFGYVVCGKSRVTSPVIRPSLPSVSMCSLQSLDDNISRFWELEGLPSKPVWSKEATMCEEHYQSTVSRQENGRYIVALPTNSKINSLGNSEFSAHRQFLALEKRLNNRQETYEKYRDFMDEYISLGHMTPISAVSRKPSYFLPHHCVTKKQSTTTKLRVVFNASSKTSSQLSLNDCLLVGPTIQSDLFSVLLRFRKHVVAFSGDIAKMYRQIRVRDDQIDLQRIWWRNHSSKKLQAFNLCTVTYGTACAPFLATRTLKQLSMDEHNRFPLASDILQTDFYVDDVLTGAVTFEAARSIKSDLINLLALGGFELRKFYSNVDQLASEDQMESSTTLVLGLIWNTKSDCLETPLDKLSTATTCTKRGILSEICSLFDSLGFCAPITLTAKLLMQIIWMQKDIGWDTNLPSDITLKWMTFKKELSELNLITVPRLVIAASSSQIELHGFSDASEKAYGCVLYIRSRNASSEYVVTLLCAKTRVTPLKRETIPRLELCAAVLLSEVVHKVISVFGIKFDAIYYWTDSKVTLFRIKSEAYKYATFVANRITKIQELSSSTDWNYVGTKENPADIVSRGLMPSQLGSACLWWNGPDFLNFPAACWSSESPQCHQETIDLELRKTSNPSLVQQDDHEIFHRFQAVNRLFRVVAYVFRFVNNARHANVRQSSTSILLKPTEIYYASVRLVKMVQNHHYANDIRCIAARKPIPNNSLLLPLSPFMDDEGILRVGGRLRNAEVTENHKHPILLPKHHILSSMIVRNEHIKLLHAGPQALLYNLRMTYWIIGARSLCRNIVHSCVTCFRSRPRMRHQIMGDLPADRVNRVDRAFTIVGIDFCGPFLLSQSVRSKNKVKCYICVFVCFATKAVHMEIVMNLSTEAFIASLRRFVSRRGICHKIYSDNATNFIGARSELKELKRLFLSQSFQFSTLEYCNIHNIEWLTIPPRSPHFGGLWEAAIKSSKHLLVRVIGNASFSIEEFLTLTTQVEACLNSRPLTPMSSDPSDLGALSPGHFLIGSQLTAIPEPSLIDLTTNRLSRFQKVQQMMQNFWARWHVEYLSELQKRTKWNQGSFPIRVGDLAILHEDNQPPMKWVLGRITAVHPGSDGVVRVVSLKTARNELKRAVSRISILPNQ